MVCAECHEGKGIICLDEANAYSLCRKEPEKCGRSKYPDIKYIYRSQLMIRDTTIHIPSNAIAINTSKDGASWLEPVTNKKAEDKKGEKNGILQKKN